MSRDEQGTSADLERVRREAREQREAATAAATPPAQLVARKHALIVRYTTPADGVEHRESMVMRAPNKEDRHDLAIARARLCFGMPFEAYAPEDQVRIRALAGVAILVEGAAPWLLEAMEEDDDLLFAVFSEVDAHASRYFLGDGGEGEGEASKRRLEVRSEPLPL